MKREDLKALGLEDGAVDSIMALHGKDIESHKAKVNTAQAEIDGLKSQLTEASTTIEGFKKLDVDSIKAAADDWKAKAEQAQADAAKSILSTKRAYALEKELKETYKVKNVKSVKAHLDDEKIQFDEKTESFIGLKEQIEPIKSTNDYLFADTTPVPKIITGGNSQSVVSDPFDAAMRKGAGLATPTK